MSWASASAPAVWEPPGPLCASGRTLSEPTLGQGPLPAPALAVFSPEIRQLSAVFVGPRDPQSQGRIAGKQGPYHCCEVQPQLRPGRVHPKLSFGSLGWPLPAQRHHARFGALRIDCGRDVGVGLQSVLPHLGHDPLVPTPGRRRSVPVLFSVNERSRSLLEHPLSLPLVEGTLSFFRQQRGSRFKFS
eukprot:753537-Amphidinium_carterae.2